MTQSERRHFLIEYLLAENPPCRGASPSDIPQDETKQRDLLRSLLNVRPALPASEEFMRVQDAYLVEEIARRGITPLSALAPIQTSGHEHLYLWRGDITTLRVDAIVNAANSGMTGCWSPCHSCIDNCIHTYAGIQLRKVCDELIRQQGHAEPTGCAKITPAFNLPCNFVLHTVGPIIGGTLTRSDRRLLASCYASCLDLAADNGVHSIAFCCISTGVFHFPAQEAAEIAVATVKYWLQASGSDMSIVFNVFTESDEGIYKSILGLTP